MSFKVGDRVVDSRSEKIGRVVSVSPKRGDVLVEYDNYRQTYDSMGHKLGCDLFYRSHISELTPEIYQHLNDKAAIENCKRLFDQMRNSLTEEQARKIRDILKGTELMNVPEEPKSSTITNTDF